MAEVHVRDNRNILTVPTWRESDEPRLRVFASFSSVYLNGARQEHSGKALLKFLASRSRQASVRPAFRSRAICREGKPTPRLARSCELPTGFPVGPVQELLGPVFGSLEPEGSAERPCPISVLMGSGQYPRRTLCKLKGAHLILKVSIVDESALLRSLQEWDLGELFELSPLAGGINSQTWKLRAGRGTFVAKFAFDTTAFEGGIEIAEQLELAGFSAGKAIRRRNGSLILLSSQGALAILAFVPGSPLDASHPEGMSAWGSTMALLHRALLRLSRVPAGVRRWPWQWLDPAADHVRSRPWLQNALTLAVSEAEKLPTTRELTLGIVHGDGAPVIADSVSNRFSVIDWGAAMWGPLLYDIASAYWFSVIERGCDPSVFKPFAQAYRDEGPLSAEEWQCLEVFIRLREVVQGFYYAWRCDNNIQTGLNYPGENEQKLAYAKEKIELQLSGKKASLLLGLWSGSAD
jgi:Ser/Thr protein kinase RdoA (MazF antagonist)